MSEQKQSAKLKRCPFCNTHNLSVHLNSTAWWIECLDCNACGPLSSNAVYAVQLWNGTCTKAGYTSLVTDAKSSNRDQTKDIEL
jgi:transcription elongation factor Elf1